MERQQASLQRSAIKAFTRDKGGENAAEIDAKRRRLSKITKCTNLVVAQRKVVQCKVHDGALQKREYLRNRARRADWRERCVPVRRFLWSKHDRLCQFGRIWFCTCRMFQVSSHEQFRMEGYPRCANEKTRRRMLLFQFLYRLHVRFFYRFFWLCRRSKNSMTASCIHLRTHTSHFKKHDNI